MTIQLPRSIVEKLRVVADANGGVGRTKWFDEDGKPCCIEGIAFAADGFDKQQVDELMHGQHLIESIMSPVCPTYAALRTAHLGWERSDTATWQQGDSRTPFSTFLTLLNVEIVEDA